LIRHPASERVEGEFEALLVNVTWPVTLPVVVGEKFMLKHVLWPADRIRGRARPLALKPVPLTFELETVTLAVPVFCANRESALVVCTITRRGRAKGYRPALLTVPSDIEVEFQALLTQSELTRCIARGRGSEANAERDALPGGERHRQGEPDHAESCSGDVRTGDLDAASPALVAVTGSVLVLPIATFPKLSQGGIERICLDLGEFAGKLLSGSARLTATPMVFPDPCWTPGLSSLTMVSSKAVCGLSWALARLQAGKARQIRQSVKRKLKSR
jgi:hypothetical protein